MIKFPILSSSVVQLFGGTGPGKRCHSPNKIPHSPKDCDLVLSKCNSWSLNLETFRNAHMQYGPAWSTYHQNKPYHYRTRAPLFYDHFLLAIQSWRCSPVSRPTVKSWLFTPENCEIENKETCTNHGTSWDVNMRQSTPKPRSLLTISKAFIPKWWVIISNLSPREDFSFRGQHARLWPCSVFCKQQQPASKDTCITQFN